MPSFDEHVRFLPNPFHDIIAPDSLTAADGGAPMFEEAMIGWTKAVAAMEATPPQGRSVILAAASGVGKTHLLLRFRLALRARAAFARIYPWPSADVFHRNLLNHLVRDWAKPWADDAPGPLFDLAEACGDAAAEDPLRRALGLLSVPGAADVALRWLKGQSVEDDALNLHKLPVVEDDVAARRMLYDLLKLMTPRLPVVIAFDQLDSAPRDAQGAPNIQPLLDFNTQLRDHAELSPRVLVILSLLDENWSRLKLNGAQKSDLDRIDKRKGFSFQLKGSTAEECRAVGRLRLEPIHAAAAAAGAEPPADPLYPLAPEHLTDRAILGARAMLPIRDFLRHAATLYQSYKIGLEGGGPAPDATRKPDPIQGLWLELRAAAEQEIQAEGVLDADALRGLIYAWGGLTGRALPPDESILRAPYGAFGRMTPDGRLAVWFEDASNYRFYHLMTRVKELAEKRVLFFRAHEVLPKSGLKGRQIFDELFENHERNRFVRPNLAFQAMAMATRRLAAMLETGDIPGLTLTELLAQLNDLGAFKPLAHSTTGGQPGDGSLLLEAQKIIQDYVGRELLIGWPYVRERLQKLLPKADIAIHGQAVGALIAKGAVRWVDATAPMSQRLLMLPVADAA